MEAERYIAPELRELERTVNKARIDSRKAAAGWARVLTCAVPGLGHIFVGSMGAGVVYLALWCIAVGLVVSGDPDNRTMYLIGSIAVWLISLVHIHSATKEEE